MDTEQRLCNLENAVDKLADAILEARSHPELGSLPVPPATTRCAREAKGLIGKEPKGGAAGPSPSTGGYL